VHQVGSCQVVGGGDSTTSGESPTISSGWAGGNGEGSQLGRPRIMFPKNETARGMPREITPCVARRERRIALSVLGIICFATFLRGPV